MQDTCGHAVSDWDMCPARCAYAQCDRSTYEFTSDPALVFDPTVDREQALKQNCLWCKFFLTNGPRRVEGEQSETREERRQRLLDSEK